MRTLAAADFDDVLEFVATGGYALAVYERFRRLERGADGLWRLRRSPARAALPHERRHDRRGADGPRAAQEPAPGARRARGMVRELAGAGRRLPVRRPGPALRGPARHLRRVDPGAARACSRRCRATSGTRMAFTTHLSDRVRGYLAEPGALAGLPPEVLEWLELQRARSVMPATRRAADRDLSARRARLPGGLQLRRLERAPDARHAADPADGAPRPEARWASMPATTWWRSGA